MIVYRHRMILIYSLVAGWLLWGTGWIGTPAYAQIERYELGRRLRVFEKAWDQIPDPEARQRTTALLDRAVQSFFGFRLPEAGKMMDEAWFALQSAEAPDPKDRWARSLRIRLERRLLDAANDRIAGDLAPFHSPKEPIPAQARLRLTLKVGGHQAETLVEPIASWPVVFDWDWRPNPTLVPDVFTNVDASLIGVVEIEGRARATIEQTVSLVSDLDSRLTRLDSLLTSWEAADDSDQEAASQSKPEAASPPRTTDRLSLRLNVDLLKGLKRGNTYETDYPAARLLAEAEALAQALQDGRSFHGPDRVGQAWLNLALPRKRSWVVRVQVPENGPEVREKGQTLPLVLALHGAGGTENLFFDGYGDGALAKVCARRGWLMVAPRSGFGIAPLPELIDELARTYPIDRQRIALVGHSMGAGQAVTAVSARPELYRAVVALGGGGRVTPRQELAHVPFLIGVGDRDFALRGARQLRDALQQLNPERLEYEEFPHIEHLAIVQAAMDRVDRFLQSALDRDR